MSNQLGIDDIVLEVSDFVALVNQTFEYAFATVTIRGELANLRISKQKWVYFDLKDKSSLVHFFGSVHQLQMPLEEGMILRVRGTPRLHPQYGFSITVTRIIPEGEGALRRAAELLRSRLKLEGLFDDDRKRLLPFPPEKVGLITSMESAAYADFIKILNTRWRGVEVYCVDVQVQGEAAPEQIVAAYDYFNQLSDLPDVIVMIRGGGSPEDLYTFNTEPVARAVASSRIPTLVAIGHEIDLSLAELAADKRASTPSNAAELLVPDSREVLAGLVVTQTRLLGMLQGMLQANYAELLNREAEFDRSIKEVVALAHQKLVSMTDLLDALDPHAVLKRGFAVIRNNQGQLIRHIVDLPSDAIVGIELSDGKAKAKVL